MKKALFAGATLLLPVLASAQLTNVQNNIITPIGNIINTLIPIAFAAALLFFFYGLATYILSKEHDKEVAKKRMIWGVVALFIMASIWGIVNFLATSVGVDQRNTAPQVSPLIPR